MKHIIKKIYGLMPTGRMASTLIMMFAIACLISCDDFTTSKVSIRHFYVTYTIEDDGTNADVSANLKALDASGDEIELADTDSISVNGEVMTDVDYEEGLVYSALITSSDRYTIEFDKAGKVYTDEVEMPLALDSLTIPLTLSKNGRFEIDWGNHEDKSMIVLHFYQGDESFDGIIQDDESTIYNGDNSAWLDGFTSGSVAMIACRTRNYEINREFRGGEIIVRGPWTTEASFTLE